MSGKALKVLLSGIRNKYKFRPTADLDMPTRTGERNSGSSSDDSPGLFHRDYFVSERASIQLARIDICIEIMAMEALQA